MMKWHIVLALVTLGMVVSVDAFETRATHALLMDADTGYVIFEKRADEAMHPASMSKLMTAYMIFDAVKKNQLDLDDELSVSENAWRKGGAKSGSSTMFLEPKQRVRVGDLIRGIIVQSGNDACIVAAEHMAGSEGGFADMMTIKAKELGLTKSIFANATGIPHENHKMSAHDLALLAQRLIVDFPEFYPIYSEKEFTYNKIKQGNRNPLLYNMPGADGLKTGHTNTSGYGLTGSVVTNDGRRLIMVINGLKSMEDRSRESQKLVSYGISSFRNINVFEQDKPVIDVPVWLGEQKTVAGVPSNPVLITLSRAEKPIISSIVRYARPVTAPIHKGDKIGTITTTLSDNTVITTDLVAANDVPRVGYWGKLKATLTPKHY